VKNLLAVGLFVGEYAIELLKESGVTARQFHRSLSYRIIVYTFSERPEPCQVVLQFGLR
jgi:hypothetical protein